MTLLSDVHAYTQKERQNSSTPKHSFYRPQRRCGQGNIFTPVCYSVHRGSASVHAGIPPRSRHPPGTRPPPPPGPDPHPRDQTPQNQTPRDQTHPPGTRPTPPRDQTPQEQTPRDQTPREADSSIRSMSGRYASFWNAFFFPLILTHIAKSNQNQNSV